MGKRPRVFTLLYIYIGHANAAGEQKFRKHPSARNSYLNTSGSRLILAFRNSGRRRIYSIAEAHTRYVRAMTQDVDQSNRRNFAEMSVRNDERQKKEKEILSSRNAVVRVINKRVPSTMSPSFLLFFFVFFSVKFMLNQRMTHAALKI